MLPQDSIVSEPVVSAIIADTTVHRPARQQTPYQAVRMLPKDACLPHLPQYYRETFFAKDTLLHPELSGGRYGVAGDPVVYTVRNDDAITGTLLFCFMMTIVVFSYSRHIFAHQLKAFFQPLRQEGGLPLITSRFFNFLGIQTCLLMGITYYFYTISYVTDDLLIDTPYMLIGIFSAVILAYFLGKQLVYHIVNTIFFGSKKNELWRWNLTLMTALEGIVLFPAVILQVYFMPPIQNILYYFVFVIFLAKILTFYKCWSIFFRQKRDYLQIILYLCALEIVPMLVLWGALELMTNELKVIF